jgi:hypothetical protein
MDTNARELYGLPARAPGEAVTGGRAA